MCRHTLLVSFVFVISAPFLTAQDAVFGPEQQDSFNYEKVMIVPYDPDMHFIDDEEKIAAHNEVEVEDLRKRFRYGLGYNVNARILTEYKTKNMIADTAQEVQRDLHTLYKNLNYRYAEPTRPLAAQDNESTSAEVHASSAGSMKARLASPEAQVKPLDEDRYMHAEVADNALLQYMADRYNVDIFVFLNQFEIRTNYENCMDRAYDRYSREVWVHFSVYDARGHLLHGDVVHVEMAESTHDLDRIIYDHFPMIGEYVAGQLPRKKRLQEDGEGDAEQDWLMTY